MHIFGMIPIMRIVTKVFMIIDILFLMNISEIILDG